MILSEIVTSGLRQLNNRLQRGDNPDQLGSGLYANVYRRKSDPNTVTKVARAVTHKSSDDGYVGFIQHIIDMHNPYFPQVSELKEIVDRDGEFAGYVVRMEKLQTMHQLSDEEIDALMHKILGEEVNFRTPGAVVGGFTVSKSVARDTPRLIGAIIEDQYQNPNSSVIKDPALLEALDMLRKLAKKGQYSQDLHEGNMMIRRTPYGPQLVITDPFHGYNNDDSRNRY